MRLEGQVAIITGAGRGIGKAIALCFAKEGACVVVGDINPNVDDAFRRDFNECRRLILIKTDVTVRAESERLISAALEAFGRIDILVNNAGITRNAAIVEMTEEDWDSVIAVNLKGTFNCIKAVSGQMMRQRYGKIINISSVAGLGASNAGANYAASKAGVIQLTKVAAKELGPYGVTVNAVAPGMILTDLSFTRRSEKEVEQLLVERKRKILLGRVGTPEDVAKVVLFLASEESAYITAQVIAVDGGRSDKL